MKIAIGLPTAVPNTPGSLWVDWARRAEELGFSGLATIGRTVFDSHEELIVLAACAAVTQKLRLLTTVMIGPPRENVLLAKQSATLQALSGGRLTLGLGVGWRSDDFEVTGHAADWPRRGQLMENQIARLREVWRSDVIGPRVTEQPEIMLGGNAPAALERAGKLADAYIAGPFPIADVKSYFEAVDRAAGGRKVRRLGSRYFTLGDELTEEMNSNAIAYYSAGGPEFVSTTMKAILRTPEQIRQAVREHEEAGVDEFCLWPQVNRLNQVERLAQVLAG